MLTVYGQVAGGGAPMRAVRQDGYGAPGDVLSIREVPKPDATGDRVLLRVRAASVNPVEWRRVRADPIVARMEGWRRPKDPAIGSDVAGVVEAVGPEVTELKPGDEVFGARMGAYAEYVLGGVRNFVPKPANVS